MRSLKRVFEKLKRENPNWSDYICFSHTISGKGFSKKVVSGYFNKLVDKDDYSRGERKEVLERLFWLSQRTEKRLEEGRFQG